LQEPGLIEPLAQEYKHVTTQWIKAQFILDKPGKRMDPETHVCRFAVQKVPAGMGKRQHELLGQGLEKTGLQGAIEVNRNAGRKIDTGNCRSVGEQEAILNSQKAESSVFDH